MVTEAGYRHGASDAAAFLQAALLQGTLSVLVSNYFWFFAIIFLPQHKTKNFVKSTAPVSPRM